MTIDELKPNTPNDVAADEIRSDDEIAPEAEAALRDEGSDSAIDVDLDVERMAGESPAMHDVAPSVAPSLATTSKRRPRSRPLSTKIVAGGVFLALTAGAALLGTVATRKSVKSVWYKRLRKSRFQPPNRAFAPVWTALYGLIAVSGYRVWSQPPSPARTKALGLWGAQLALNAGWTWLFFGAKKPSLALAEIGALGGSIALYMQSAKKVDPLASALVAPYLGWVTFASTLNGAIVVKNR